MVLIFCSSKLAFVSEDQILLPIHGTKYHLSFFSASQGFEGADPELAAIVTLASSVDYTTSNSSLKLLVPLVGWPSSRLTYSIHGQEPNLHCSLLGRSSWDVACSCCPTRNITINHLSYIISCTIHIVTATLSNFSQGYDGSWTAFKAHLE